MKKIPLPSILTDTGRRLPMEASGCAFVRVQGIECLFILSDNGYLCRLGPNNPYWRVQKITITDPEALAVTRAGTLLIGAESSTVAEYRPCPLCDEDRIVEHTGRTWTLDATSAKGDNSGMEGMAYWDTDDENNLGYLLASTQMDTRWQLYALSINGGVSGVIRVFTPVTARSVSDLHMLSDRTLLTLTDDRRGRRYESAIVLQPQGSCPRWFGILPYAGAEGLAVSPKSGRVVVVLDQNKHQMRQNGLKKNLLLMWESLDELRREIDSPKKKKNKGA